MMQVRCVFVWCMSLFISVYITGMKMIVDELMNVLFVNGISYLKLFVSCTIIVNVVNKNTVVMKTYPFDSQNMGYVYELSTQWIFCILISSFILNSKVF